MNHLPTELLLTILELFTPQSHNRRELIAVVNLSAVCKKWRNIVINTPSFWTYMTLSPSYNERNRQLIWYTQRLELHLQRTGDALLHVNWYFNGKNYAYLKFARIIYAYAPLNRWRSLSLCLGNHVIECSLHDGISIIYGTTQFPYLSGAFEHLEELSVHGDRVPSFQFVALVEESALRLRRLDLGDAYLPFMKIYFPRSVERIERHAAGRRMVTKTKRLGTSMLYLT